MDREKQPEAVAVMKMMNGWMVVTDPPVHKRLRRLAAKAFNPRRVAAKEGRIQELVDELLDSFIESGSDRFVQDFAFPLPADRHRRADRRAAGGHAALQGLVGRPRPGRLRRRRRRAQ